MDRWLCLAGLTVVLTVAGFAARLAAGASVPMGAVPDSAPRTDTSAEQRIAALEARIAELEGRAEERWLNERRAAEVKALVREVLDNAETRASLLENGMYAGHDGKSFFLKSADGGFLLRISGQMQMRYVVNFRDGQRDSASSPAAGDDNTETGFELRRTKIQFAGHIADPRFQYKIRIAVDRTTNTVEGEEVLIAYQLTNAITLFGGETKAPLLREELVSSQRQLAVERSYVNEIFTGGFVQGAGGIWYDPEVLNDSLKVTFAVTDGARSGEAPPSTIPLTQPTREVSKRFYEDASDFAATVRADLRLAGDWGKWGEFTSWPGEDTSIFLGAAIHQEYGETGDDVDGNNNFTLWTVDGSLQTNGLSVFAAFMMLHTDNEDGFADYDPWGVVAQLGYNMPVGDNYIEPFIRYEHIDLDDFASDLGLSSDEIDMITVGVNYYLAKHNAKLSLDVVWALDSVPLSQTGLHVLADAPDEEDQIILRTQFQLLF